MAPAAYHRIVYAGEASQRFHELGSRFVMAATVFLALGLAADVYVVIAKIAGATIGLGAAVAALVLLVGLWHVSPIFIRSHRGGTSKGPPFETQAHSRIDGRRAAS
jgi:hypothetical protein